MFSLMTCSEGQIYTQWSCMGKKQISITIWGDCGCPFALPDVKTFCSKCTFNVFCLPLDFMAG